MSVFKMAPPKSNAVHRYFTYDKHLNTSTCELCMNKLKGKHATNLKNHLAVKHPSEFKVVEELNKDFNRKSDQTVGSVTKNKTEILKKLCVRLITVHGRPLAMMEDEAFQSIINMAAGTVDADRSLNIKAIKSKIYEEADEVRRKISAETKNKMISLKIDAATCLERKFLGVNIQYICNGKIVVRNLAVVEMYDSQTSSFLRNTIEEILSDFKIIPHQIYCICTDNGSNMIKMVKMLGGTYASEDYNCSSEHEEEVIDEDEVSEEEDFEEQEPENIFNSTNVEVESFISNDREFKIRGMLCAAHTLQLAVKDAIASDITVQATLGIARVVVNILRKPNNMNRLKQEELKKPIKDCVTRWTSTHNMLERLITLQDFCKSILEISTLTSNNFWYEIESLVNCLKPIKEATIILQKQQLTIGDFYITWLNCKNQVAAFVHSFAVALHTSMEQRESKLFENDVVLEALYLDSRLNVLLSRDQCQKARKLLNELYLQNNSLNNQIPVESEHYDTESDRVACTSSNYSAVEALLQSRERVRRNSVVTQKTSFDICLNELCLIPRLNLNENIIMHWQNKAVVWSELATVANIVLGAPATQVSVERLFSSLKFVLHPLRNNISPLFLRNIMIVRENKDLI